MVGRGFTRRFDNGAIFAFDDNRIYFYASNEAQNQKTAMWKVTRTPIAGLPCSPTRRGFISDILIF